MMLANNPALPATLAAIRPRQDRERELCRRSRQRAGTRNTATNSAANIANVFVQASGPKSFRSRPVKKNTGKKLTMVVETPVITAGVTS